MGELVLPATGKLEDALQFARDSTLKIIEIMQAAEVEAAATCHSTQPLTLSG